MYKKLKKLRELNRLTQEDMTKLLGYKSKNAYSLKERGERKFTVEEAILIAKHFKVSVEEIFLKSK